MNAFVQHASQTLQPPTASGSHCGVRVGDRVGASVGLVAAVGTVGDTVGAGVGRGVGASQLAVTENVAPWYQ